MIQAALALVVAGALIAGYAVWRLGGDLDLVIGWFLAEAFVLGAALFAVGLFILVGVGIWKLFG